MQTRNLRFGNLSVARCVRSTTLQLRVRLCPRRRARRRARDRVPLLLSGLETAFDVARPSVVSRILSLTGVHGHVAAALLAEIQVQPASKIVKQRSGTRGASGRAEWKIQCCGDAWPNTCCGNLRRRERQLNPPSPSLSPLRSTDRDPWVHIGDYYVNGLLRECTD